MSEVAEQEQSSAPAPESSLEDRLVSKLFGNEQPEEEEGQEQPEGEESSETIAADEQSDEGEERPAEGAELVEVEFSGKQYKLPPELKDALMAQSDYTRKTQEVAEQRRMLDAERLMQQQEAQFQQVVAPEMQQLQQLDWQLAAYKGLDWSAMDTETMTRTRVALDQLKDARNEILQSVNGKRQQFDAHMQGVMQQAREVGNNYLKKHIPNWGAETGRELTSYAISEGYSDVELSTLTDARMIKTLWKARQWDQLQSQKGNPKRADKAPPGIKPGATKPITQQNADAAYRKALRSAKNSSDKQRIIQARLEQKFG